MNAALDPYEFDTLVAGEGELLQYHAGGIATLDKRGLAVFFEEGEPAVYGARVVQNELKNTKFEGAVAGSTTLPTNWVQYTGGTPITTTVLSVSEDQITLHIVGSNATGSAKSIPLYLVQAGIANGAIPVAVGEEAQWRIRFDVSTGATHLPVFAVSECDIDGLALTYNVLHGRQYVQVTQTNDFAGTFEVVTSGTEYLFPYLTWSIPDGESFDLTITIYDISIVFGADEDASEFVKTPADATARRFLASVNHNDVDLATNRVTEQPVTVSSTQPSLQLHGAMTNHAQHSMDPSQWSLTGGATLVPGYIDLSGRKLNSAVDDSDVTQFGLALIGCSLTLDIGEQATMVMIVGKSGSVSHGPACRIVLAGQSGTNDVKLNPYTSAHQVTATVGSDDYIVKDLGYYWMVVLRSEAATADGRAVLLRFYNAAVNLSTWVYDVAGTETHNLLYVGCFKEVHPYDAQWFPFIRTGSSAAVVPASQYGYDAANVKQAGSVWMTTMELAFGTTLPSGAKTDQWAAMVFAATQWGGSPYFNAGSTKSVMLYDRPNTVAVAANAFTFLEGTTVYDAFYVSTDRKYIYHAVKWGGGTPVTSEVNDWEGSLTADPIQLRLGNWDDVNSRWALLRGIRRFDVWDDDVGKALVDFFV